MSVLLAPDDPPPYQVLNPDARPPLLLVCDHAGQRVPGALSGLGVEPAVLDRHVGWDIGAEALTRFLAHRFQATAVVATYSRLVIDLNRAPGDPSAMPEEADGHVVPGNRGLDEAARERRREALFWPYHDAIARRLAHLARQGTGPALVSIHTFTPVLAGAARPWHIGVLHNQDDRLARALMGALARQAPAVVVGDNEPYSGREVGYTTRIHAEAVGLPHLAVEVRQDLVDTQDGVEAWGTVLGDALEAALRGDEAPLAGEQRSLAR
ncbi:N-formylglutamate amidohydrolase [Pararhodospirillum oryzae]|uniref:N-formylglutamate amidohydrolase n=1 Tax=Pararhodospirillum oryzae TaxID=478448 RepID=A0A512H3Z3_9PROT|nr:N-formylglutamate amidohydrolase [Pararhodospirillum oryzae]GEO80186.1 N-formylglutamate amidohydrolase [Pararhodospirillum oryzae]